MSACARLQNDHTISANNMHARVASIRVVHITNLFVSTSRDLTLLFSILCIRTNRVALVVYLSTTRNFFACLLHLYVIVSVRGQPSTGVPDHGNGLPMSSQDSDDEVKDMTRPLLDVSAARQTESEIPSIGDMILVRPSTDDETATGHKFCIGKLIEGTYFIYCCNLISLSSCAITLSLIVII